MVYIFVVRYTVIHYMLFRPNYCSFIKIENNIELGQVLCYQCHGSLWMEYDIFISVGPIPSVSQYTDTRYLYWYRYRYEYIVSVRKAGTDAYRYRYRYGGYWYWYRFYMGDFGDIGMGLNILLTDTDISVSVYRHRSNSSVYQMAIIRPEVSEITG